jgi:hypothetical protein
MNTSTFTSAQLRQILPRMVAEGRGVTLNDCGYDSQLIEFSPDKEIEILSAEESNELVTVEFSQDFEDELDGWTWRYSTVQEVPLMKAYLEADAMLEQCQCLHEIHNKLPRTKFCMVPCKTQLEARKLLRK